MENEALSKAELADLVEGWKPRGVVVLQDLVSNGSAALAGMLAAETSPGAVVAIGSVLQIGNALAGPRHPYVQAFVGSPGVGMVDAGLGIMAFLRRQKKKAAQQQG